MPVFEPSHDQEARRLFLNAPEPNPGERVVLPDDAAFLAEFVSQYHMNIEARAPPLEDLYVGNERMKVSTSWAYKFVHAWETFNCHKVTVRGVDNTLHFRACNQFWEEIKREIERYDGTEGNDGEIIDIFTNREPSVKLYASNNRWSDLVNHWETVNRCSLAQRQLVLDQRRAEPKQEEPTAFNTMGAEYQDVGGVIPVPHMALPLSAVQSIPSSQFEGDANNTNFDFKADSNFWKCLQRFSAWVPEASQPPAFLVGSEGDQLIVNTVFMRQFIQAWRELFPYTIIIATNDQDGKVVSTFFNAHSAVWHELTLRSVGFASPDNQRNVPPGYHIARTMEDTASPPILLKAQAYRDVVRIWPDQFPSDGKGIGIQLNEEPANRVKPRPAPCVLLPKADKPGRRKRPAGAPRSRRVVCFLLEI